MRNGSRRANQVRPQQVKCEKSYFRKHLLPAPVAAENFLKGLKVERARRVELPTLCLASTKSRGTTLKPL